MLLTGYTPVVGLSEEDAREASFRFNFDVNRDPQRFSCYFWDRCGTVAEQDPPPNFCLNRTFGVVRVWLYDDLFTPPDVRRLLLVRAKTKLAYRRFPIDEQLDSGPIRDGEMAADPQLRNRVRTENPELRNRVAVQNPDPDLTPRIRTNEIIRLIPYEYVGAPLFGDSTVPDVTGLVLRQAIETLSENGLLFPQNVQAVLTHDPNLDNRVAFQNPRSCTQVPRGRSILLKRYHYLHAEAGHVYLPNVRLWPLDVAVRFFRELGVDDVQVVGQEFIRAGQEDLVDFVSSQGHAENAMVRPEDARVVLTPFVRELPPAGQTLVPKFVDHHRDHALEIAALKGLALGLEGRGYRDTPNPTRDDCVATQQLDAGGPPVERDRRVLITLYRFER